MCEISDADIIKTIRQSANSRIDKEIESKKRNKLSEYFFSLSNTLLGSLVVGIILLVLGDGIENVNKWIVLSVFISGIIAVVLLAKIGYNILK